MFERFTDKAIQVILLAQEESRRLGHNFVGSEQILIGLMTLLAKLTKSEAEGTLHLRALDCQIQGAEFLPQSFDLELTGILSPHRQGRTTELRGKADLKVRVDVPSPLKLLPDSVLEQSGRAFLNGILLTIKYRLERQLLQNYHRWVKANPAEPSTPLAMSVGSSAS